MKRLILLSILIIAASLGVHAQASPLIKFLAALPATCSPTSSQQVLVYKYTATRGLYYCSAANTWTLAAAAGGAFASPALAPDGTAGAPSYSFTNSPTTGFFRSAADAIGVSTAGTERWTFNASGALNPLVSNTYDIGGSTTIRDIGIGRNAIFSGSTSGTSTLHANATAGSGDVTLPTGTGTLAKTTDNVATATALAADPADCSANNFATAINASGTLTCGQPSISAGVSGLGTSVATQLANAADGSNASGVGYRGIPPNSQSANYTTVMADAGKQIFHPSTDANARTFTIDSNANVAYPIGTAITFINMSANNVTIAITSDTMNLSGAGTTGSRTLAQYGIATALKLTATVWIISGTNLT